MKQDISRTAVETYRWRIYRWVEVLDIDDFLFANAGNLRSKHGPAPMGFLTIPLCVYYNYSATFRVTVLKKLIPLRIPKLRYMDALVTYAKGVALRLDGSPMRLYGADGLFN